MSGGYKDAEVSRESNPTMTPNPFLIQVRSRIAVQGGWSRRVLHPSALVRCEAPQRRVFLITREDRRFAVVADNFVEADNRLTTLLTP
jgi:hypothetical protein